MFDPETEKATEQRRSRLIMLLGAVGALILAAVVVYFTRLQPSPQATAPAQATLENAVRAGAPEFESYKDKLTVEDKDVLVYPNLLGMTQYRIKGKLLNRGDRTLIGIEVAGKLIGAEDKTLAENTSLPIPRQRSQLKPGESMPIDFKVDAPASIKRDDVWNVIVEIRGLRFQ
jgi:hypothetical protein